MPDVAFTVLAPMRQGVLCCALLLLLTAGCSPVRAVDSAVLLADFEAGEGPSRLKETTPAPRRLVRHYEVAGRAHEGDLYLPGEPARAALVLVPGVTPEGKDDPRLVSFAKGLARARFVVLVPDIENLKVLKVSASDARNIGDAVQYLAASPEVPSDFPLGIVAVSYAVGPAVLAALRHKERPVDFLVAIGGYYDMEAMIAFTTTGFYRDGGSWRRLAANAYGKWIFLQSNADRLADPVDRDALAAMAARKLRDPDADIDDLAARLGPEGRAVHDLLRNRVPERVATLLDALPLAIRDEIHALNLARQALDGLTARVILVHGRDDSVVPFGESRALAAAFSPGQAELFLVDSLAHVDLGPAGLDDTLTLWRAVYRLLEARDRAALP